MRAKAWEVPGGLRDRITLEPDRKSLGDQFNDQVAQRLAEHPETIVRTRVTKFDRIKIEKERGQLIGDIDVFVTNQRRRQSAPVRRGIARRVRARVQILLRRRWQGRLL